MEPDPQEKVVLAGLSFFSYSLSRYGPEAHRYEQPAHNRLVVSSNLTRATTHS